MNYKCDRCGIIGEITHQFVYDDYSFGYSLEFCYNCGNKIKQKIDDLNKKKK